MEKYGSNPPPTEVYSLYLDFLLIKKAPHREWLIPTVILFMYSNYFDDEVTKKIVETLGLINRMYAKEETVPKFARIQDMCQRKDIDHFNQYRRQFSNLETPTCRTFKLILNAWQRLCKRSPENADILNASVEKWGLLALDENPSNLEVMLLMSTVYSVVGDKGKAQLFRETYDFFRNYLTVPQQVRIVPMIQYVPLEYRPVVTYVYPANAPSPFAHAVQGPFQPWFN